MRARQVIRSSTVRLASQIAAALLVTAAAPRVSSALAIYNETGVAVDARIYGNGDQTTVPAGGQYGCAPYYSSCVPNAYFPNEPFVVVLEVGSFSCVVQTTGWGRVHLRQEDRSALGLPPNYYCTSYDTEGDFIQTEPYGVGAGIRDVHFLVTGDPQYDNRGDNDGANPLWKANPDTTIGSMMNMKANDYGLRGLIVAGDLTENSRLNDEFAWYQSAIHDYSRFVFDGLGNHDVKEPDFWQSLACDFGTNDCVDPYAIRSAVRNRKHATVLTNQDLGLFLSSPHYSWDWHDVHFVQLNVFPGNAPPTGTAGSEIDPMNSLVFLQQDLALYVGNSRRPVVLVHHYGFDGDISLGWWTDAQRAAYWDAIAPYNVAAIFSGHNHLGANDTYRFPFKRPAGRTNGPPLIPTFDAAAAQNGAFVDVKMDQRTMIITRRDMYGVEVPIRTQNVILDDGNIALSRAAKQSSTDPGYPADRAVDGSVNGELSQGSVSRTAAELSPWWQVDFGSVQGIREIALYNRTDSGGASLYKFDILVSNDEQSWQSVYQYASLSPVQGELSLPMNVNARFVRVQLGSTGTPRSLNLAEVRVLTNRFSFGARHSGQYISVRSANTVDGIEIVQSPYVAGNHQRFEVINSGAGKKLVARHSGLCLGIKPGATPGEVLTQQTCISGAAHQQFTISEQSNGNVKLVVQASGLCVGVRNGGTSSNDPVVHETCQQNRPSQEFYMRPDP